MLLWIFKFHQSRAVANGNGPGGFSCKSETKSWPILTVERTAILMCSGWTAKSEPAVLYRATRMKSLSAWFFFFFSFPKAETSSFYLRFAWLVAEILSAFFCIKNINVLIIKASFLPFGNFIPTQIFSSVHLNCFSNGSSALSKAKRALLPICDGAGRRQVSVTKLGKSWA